MKARNATAMLLLVLAVLAVAILRLRSEPPAREAFDRSPPRLEYARYALCRMACLGISRQDVDEVVRKGVINFNQSDRRAQPCPGFALQGRTFGGKYIRVFFIQCSDLTRVVSCLDLEAEGRCDCSQQDLVAW